MPYAYDPATGEAEAIGDSLEARRYNAARALVRAARAIVGFEGHEVLWEMRKDLAAALVAWDACQEPSLLEVAVRREVAKVRKDIADFGRLLHNGEALTPTPRPV